MAYVPAGIDMQLLPVAGRTYSSLGRTIKVRNSFVCMTSSEDILQLAVAASDTGLVMDTAKWPGSCGDGEAIQRDSCQLFVVLRLHRFHYEA